VEQKKILIADDEPLNLKLYSSMLKNSVYNVLQATDGIEALSVARERLPDLIVMDWNMPRMDGLSALKKLKDDDITKEIPVIMITGVMSTSENLRTALNEGAIDFLRKPFDKIELLARIKSIILLSDSLKSLQEKYEETQVQKNFIKSLIQNISNPLVYYTIDGVVMGCNYHFEKMIGLTEEELKGTIIYRSCFQNAALHIETDMEIIQNQTEKSYEAAMKNGDEYIFSKTLFYNISGKPQGILCVMTNITEMKKAHQELMEIKKKELVSYALKLIQINELNNNLISEFGKLNSYTNKKGSEIIRRVVRQYNTSLNEGIWHDFETRFEHVYEGFYKKLMAQFPTLTPGERKLCALLRLNITSKDIAFITFHTPQSVDIARYRLRKKLNLDSGENLVDFLMKIEEHV